MCFDTIKCVLIHWLNKTFNTLWVKQNSIRISISYQTSDLKTTHREKTKSQYMLLPQSNNSAFNRRPMHTKWIHQGYVASFREVTSSAIECNSKYCFYLRILFLSHLCKTEDDQLADTTAQHCTPHLSSSCPMLKLFVPSFSQLRCMFFSSFFDWRTVYLSMPNSLLYSFLLYLQLRAQNYCNHLTATNIEQCTRRRKFF